MLHALMDTFKNSSAPRQNIEALSPFPLARLLATLLEAIVEVACCRFVVALEISPRAAASTDLRPHDRDATSASSFSPANRRSCPGFEFFKHALLRLLSLYPSLPRNPSIDESTYAQNWFHVLFSLRGIFVWARRAFLLEISYICSPCLVDPFLSKRYTKCLFRKWLVTAFSILACSFVQHLLCICAISFLFIQGRKNSSL